MKLRLFSVMQPTPSCLIQKETSFSGQKNAYAENGISPVDTYGTGQTNTTSENKDFLKDVQERAQNLVDDAKKAIDESGITEKAKNLWDTITGWFH